MNFVTILLKAFATVLVVDFVSGLVHWLEDTFWTEQTPIVGAWIVAPNTLHHRDGSAFIANSWIESSWDLTLLAAIVVILAWLCGQLTWQVWLFAVVGANANQIHKWAHLPRHRVPSFVRLLQRSWLLQSPGHHLQHHRGEKNCHYCVVTNLLNPVLDRLRFWRVLELALVPFFDAPRRADLAVRPHV